MEQKKLSQEELDQLNTYQQQRLQLLASIGEAEIQKTNFITQLGTLQQERQELGKVLQEKYGDGNIDLQTGEITPIEQVS